MTRVTGGGTPGRKTSRRDVTSFISCLSDYGDGTLNSYSTPGSRGGPRGPDTLTLGSFDSFFSDRKLKHESRMSDMVVSV